MRRIGILAVVLLLLPLVGTVALSDFNYIGQGGGGVSSSDVDTAIAAALVTDKNAAYDPLGGDGVATFNGAFVTTGYFIASFVNTGEPGSFMLRAEDIKSLPWSETWTFYLSRLGQDPSPTGGDALGKNGAVGDGTNGALLSEFDELYLPIACGDVGPILVQVTALDSNGNWFFVDQLTVIVTDPFASCGGP